MAFAEEARSVVRPLRRHAAFIVGYTGPNAAASRNGTSRHEDTNVGNQRSSSAAAASACRSLSAGRVDVVADPEQGLPLLFGDVIGTVALSGPTALWLV